MTCKVHPQEEKVINVYIGRNMFCDLAYHEIKGSDQNSVPVVFLHGLGSSKDMMVHTIIEEFRKLTEEGGVSFNIIALDMPGHGGSQTSEMMFNLDVAAMALKSFIEAMNIEKMHLYGMSMGGTIAIKFTSKHPELVETLTVQGPPINGTDWGNTGNIFRLFLKRLERITRIKSNKFKKNSKVYVSLKMIKQALLNSKDTKRMLNNSCLRSMVIKDNLRFSAHAANGYIRSILASDVTSNLCTIRKNNTPVLCLDGEKEKHRALDTSSTIKKYIPSAIVKLIPNAGHIATMLEPHATAKEFLSFLLSSSHIKNFA